MHAQKAQLFLGNVPSQNAIEIKWMGREIKPEDSYDLYRREKSGTWQKINSTPIKSIPPLNSVEIKKEAEKQKHDDALLIYSNAFQKDPSGNTDLAMNYFVLNILSASQNDISKYMGQYFIDNSIVIGNEYDYRLTYAGKTVDSFIATSSIMAAVYKQTAPPSNFLAFAKDKQIEMKWTPDKKFSQYRILRSSGVNGKSEKTLTALLSEEQVESAMAGKYFFTDKDSLLVNEKKQYYKICGVDFFGHESKLSEEISAVPKDLTPPNRIYGFRTELKNKSILLSWLISKDVDCVGYNIYKSLNEKEGFVKINVTPLAKIDATFTDNDVKEGGKYFYYLEAFDKSGNASKTDVASYVIPDMTPPNIPKNLKATSEIGKISLTWDKNSDSDLEGYYVFRALKNEESNFQLLNNEPLKSNSFTDKLLKEAGNYFLYRICAVDKNYNRSEATHFIATRMPDIVAPLPVTLMRADWKASQVKLYWSQNHERDIKGYEVWRAETDPDLKEINPQKITPLLINSKTLTYTDEKVPSSKTVLYYVVSVDSADNHSVASNKKIIALMTKARTSVAVSNLRGIYETSLKRVNLSWTEPINVIINGYKVYRKTQFGSFIPVSGVKKATAFTDKNITIGQSYLYKILSVTADSEDSYSNEIKVDTR